jgi:putative cardiolipin synthase
LRNIIGPVLLLVLLVSGGCATLPDNVDRTESFAYTETDDTFFAKGRHEEQVAHPGKSGFLLLPNGLDAFVARAILAQNAERSLDVQYYLIHSDLTGRLFIDQLIKAADRGVRVRLLVDDIDLGGRDYTIAMLDSHPQIEVRIFNPFSRKAGRMGQYVTRFGSVTRRMHNKSFTVDNQATILGGRNIGNEYFEADPDIVFADLDVLAIGPVIQEVSASFDKYWNSELAYPIGLFLDKPLSFEEIEEARQGLDDFVNQQSESDYLQALMNSNLVKDIENDRVRFYWGAADVLVDQHFTSPRSSNTIGI